MCPGDVVVITGAIRDLDLQYPEYEICMDTTCNEIWNNNPHVTTFTEKEADQVYKLEYDDVHNSNKSGRHFSAAYHLQIEKLLGIRLIQSEIWPEVFLTEKEKTAPTKLNVLKNYFGRYWILNAGYKQDYQLKHWGTHNYQELVDRLKGKVQFVQVGEDSLGHMHIPIEGAINLVGETSFKDYLRLSYHSDGSIGPVSMHMHVSAAFRKPSVIIAGGREPFRWEAYPNQRYMCTNGFLKCCNTEACWKNWIKWQVNDFQKEALRETGQDWKEKVCVDTVNDYAKCMTMITPEMVECEIMRYYEGGALEPV